jgi:hypothetical protein
MLFRGTVAVYFENHTDHTNTLCGQNTAEDAYLNVKQTIHINSVSGQCRCDKVFKNCHTLSEEVAGCRYRRLLIYCAVAYGTQQAHLRCAGNCRYEYGIINYYQYRFMKCAADSGQTASFPFPPAQRTQAAISISSRMHPAPRYVNNTEHTPKSILIITCRSIHRYLQEYGNYHNKFILLRPQGSGFFSSSIHLIFPTLVSTQPLAEMTTRNVPGCKGRPALNTDNLTPSCKKIVYRMCEPRRLTSLWASAVCYIDGFTFTGLFMETRENT